MGMIGAILGDIAGSQYEFRKPEDLNYEQCKLFTNNCKFTDDTVMTIATGIALSKGKPFDEMYQKYGRKYVNCGYGGSFYRWIHSKDPKPYRSYGNGSAMRISAISELSWICGGIDEVINVATKSAACTHNHKEGIKGAVITAVCSYMGKKSYSKADIYNYAKSMYPKKDYKYSVELSMEYFRKYYTWDVTCQGSVPVAIRCFL